MKILIILFFCLNFCALHAQQEIPSQILDALHQVTGVKNQLIAFASEKDRDYYLIREIGPEGGDELPVNQVLIAQEKNNSPQIIARKFNIFPLAQYGLEENIIKELARQYVQDSINQNEDGIEGMQKTFDYNPKFIPKAPELIEAYKKAGLKF